MKKKLMAIAMFISLYQLCFAQEVTKGLRGDSVAIADAEAMVETMGGREVWSQLKSIHFVHEWFPSYRIDRYVENEILDLTSPKSWVETKSEVYHTIRAYSPEGKYWSIHNGKFTYGDEKIFSSAMKRAPFNFYHLVRAVAAGDSFYEIRFGKGDIPQTRRLEFYGPDGILGGWVILNQRKEPIVKATPEYRYILGPLKRFGNLKIPAWGVYDNGLTEYEMISVVGDNQPPDSSLFLPPTELSD